MIRKIAFLIALYLPANLFAQDIPVMLFLTKGDQPDSLGFNIVEALPEVVYKRIMDGKAALWDSPKKEDKLAPKTLKSIESSSDATLSVTEQLFILERWNMSKKQIAITPLGFYFSTKKKNGEEISFGYVEYKDLDSVFKATVIPSNANGGCNTTFDEVLKQKLYYYNVVQYNDKRISSLGESVKIKDDIKPMLPSSWAKSDECKFVKYFIEDRQGKSDDSTKLARRLLQSIEKYFNENMEVFLNMDGDLLVGDSLDYKINVTGVQMEEYWMKNEDKIDYSIFRVTFFVNGKPLSVMTVENLQKLDILVGFKPINDFLKEKEFYFRIAKINTQEISPEQSKTYLDALFNYKWNHITEYAKYE